MKGGRGELSFHPLIYTHTFTHPLKTNPGVVEKYARENYLMKRENEDIFIVPEKPDVKINNIIGTIRAFSCRLNSGRFEIHSFKDKQNLGHQLDRQ